MEKFLIDTNVLCGSILVPSGGGTKLLELAKYNVYELVFTEVIAAEFIGKCRSGMGKNKITFSEAEIDEYFANLLPMLNERNLAKVSVGRDVMLMPNAFQLKMPELLYQLTGRTHSDLLEVIWQHVKLWPSQADLNDLHVMVGAIENQCDYIVTSNHRDFPSQIGKIRVVTQTEALAILGE